TVVATVDGRPLGVRLTGRAADLLLPGGAAAVGCRPTTLLTAGSHHLVATGPLTLESLYLADTGGSTSGSTSGTHGPQVTVTGGPPGRGDGGGRDPARGRRAGPRAPVRPHARGVV